MCMCKSLFQMNKSNRNFFSASEAREKKSDLFYAVPVKEIPLKDYKIMNMRSDRCAKNSGRHNFSSLALKGARV
jgi:hypothetical protein